MRWSRLGILSTILSMSLFAVSGCGNSTATSGSSQEISTASSKINPTTGLPVYTKKATLTFWSWVPNDDARVKIFEKYYPNIKVNLKNVGAGQTEYSKFSTAVQAGSGAPDVVMLEYDVVPEFIQSGGLKPIDNYVKTLSNSFPNWVMNQVTYNNKIYAVPEDTGPLGLYYQKSIFDSSKMSIPTTWAQFEQEANQFHKQNPNKYYSYFSTNDGQQELSLLWAAGVNPFQQSSDGTWKISLNSPQALKVFQYWGDLIKSGAVEATATDSSSSWQKQLNDGDFATIIGPAWFPSEAIAPYDSNLKAHDWKAALIPEWQQGQTVDGDWGGSADAVTTQSKYPEAAAIFATFINTSKFEQPHNVTPSSDGGGGLFPASENGFTVSQFNSGDPALNGQKANEEVFSKEATRVDPSWQWAPWSNYIFQELTTELNKAASNQESWKQALDNAQKNIVSYGKSQGYKVQG